jgi:hypothetical protein
MKTSNAMRQAMKQKPRGKAALSRRIYRTLLGSLHRRALAGDVLATESLLRIFIGRSCDEAKARELREIEAV